MKPSHDIYHKLLSAQVRGGGGSEGREEGGPL